MTPVMAAPLFPDVSTEHRGRSTVVNLAAKGLLEGYPDGTFKGDRATIRWEMAMCVVRLPAKMEWIGHPGPVRSGPGFVDRLFFDYNYIPAG
ncbi:MAG: S-layer homology domain-containing protein [Candidatus Eremiobacteraeota bacterium]|nr:S-layer homology domain-containing protein [Candidatus Eremiobacteraeota bacterium]